MKAALLYRLLVAALLPVSAAHGAPPAITLQPASTTLNAGSNPILSVGVSGSLPLAFQWYRDGEVIPGANGKQLNFTNVAPSQSAAYSVVVSNAEGSIASSNAVLQVQSPVVVTSPAASAPKAAAVGPVVKVPSVAAQPQADGVVQANGLLGRLVESVLGTVDKVLAPLLVTIGVDLTLGGGTPVANMQYAWSLNGTLIPDANGPTLQLTNIQPADGGTYSLAIFNNSGIVSNSVVKLLVNTAVLPFNRSFIARGAISGATGVGRGDNGSGQDTAWLKWVAPASGLAVLSTEGSTFDTTVTVSTGAMEAFQTVVASDDDSGGYLTSKAMFNAVAGVTYNIAVKSFNGSDAGNFQLLWNLVATQYALPSNISNPVSTTVNRGETAQFTVSFQSVAPLSLQWFHDGQPVAGQTQKTLTVPNVQEADLGEYSLMITTPDLTFATVSAELQINTEGLDALAVNKQADASARGIVGTLLGSLSTASSSRVAAQASGKGDAKTGVGKLGGGMAFAGYTGTQIFKSSPGKDPGEPNYCNVVGGSSFWLSYKPGQNGVLSLNTDGSAYDTLLAVYTDDGSNQGYNSLVWVAWDNNSGANGLTSKLSFNATAGTTYYIVVDGVKGAYGTVNLNYSLNVLPTISQVNSTTINQDQNTGPITFTIGDFETPATSLTVNGACADSTMVSSDNIVFGGSGTNRTVTITPSCSGTNWVTLSVTDAGGATTSKSFLLQVAKVNHAPVANPSSFTRQPSNKINISLSAILQNCSDADKDTLTLATVTAKSINGGTLTKGSTFITYTPPSGNNATDRFTYTISDGKGGTTTGTAYIYVNSSTGVATAY